MAKYEPEQDDDEIDGSVIIDADSGADAGKPVDELDSGNGEPPVDSGTPVEDSGSDPGCTGENLKIDTDGDEQPDCRDPCAMNPLRVNAGPCGCEGDPKDDPVGGAPCGVMPPERGCKYLKDGATEYWVCEVSEQKHAAARTKCQQRNMDLAVFETKAENDKILALRTKWDLWIGLNETGLDGIWHRPDGTDPGFQNFDGNGGSAFGGTNDQCVVMQGNGKWDDRSCNENRGYVCETERECTPTSPSPSVLEVCDGLDNDCNGSIDDASVCNPTAESTLQCGAATIAGRVYLSCRNKEGNFAAAKAFCEARGSKLARIHNQAENDVLARIRRGMGGGSLWFGATDDAAHGSSDGNWIWIDGAAKFWQGAGSGATPAGVAVGGLFANWNGSGEPNGGVGEGCAMTESDQGTWVDVGCDANRRFVCAK